MRNMRRQFLRKMIGLLAAPPVLLVSHLGRAQQQSSNVARIAFLGATSSRAYAPRIAALRDGLRELGYAEGRNLIIEFRWAEGKPERLPDLADELVRLQPDVIVTHAHAPTMAAKRATAAIPIPIVMTNVGDAVGNGIVASLARPGGNITGDSFLLPELIVKRMEVLREVLPYARRIAVLINPDNPGLAPLIRSMDEAASILQLSLQYFALRNIGELSTLFAAIATAKLDALLVLEDATTTIIHAAAIADGAAQQKLLAVGFGDFARAGGTIGYGVDFLALYYRAAVFVDKILKGSRPVDLPVEQPTKFELIVNLKGSAGDRARCPTGTPCACRRGSRVAFLRPEHHAAASSQELFSHVRSILRSKHCMDPTRPRDASHRLHRFPLGRPRL
jgi:putative tryptophan/tyrosine transport system substrate-binding protein